MLKISNLNVIIDDYHILDNINLKFNNTGLYYINGVSGSGKTTFFRALVNDITYTGEISYNGINLKEKNNLISLIEQEILLFDNLSVKNNIINILKMSGSEIDLKYIDYLLNEFQIYDSINKKCKFLSGGERQRVKIIIELCKDTKILLCDEIISGLDEEISRKILNILVEKSKTKLIIITSHNEDIIKDFTNQIIIFDYGKIVSDKINEAINTEGISMSNSFKKKIKFKDLFSFYFKMMNKTSFALFSLILSILILLVSIVIEASTYNSDKEKYNSIERNFPYAKVGDYYYTNNKNKDDYINTLKENGFEDYYLYEIIRLDNFIDDSSYLEDVYPMNDYNIECFGVSYSSETLEKLNIKLICGKIPQKSNEVLIPEFYYWMMKKHGFKNDNISIKKEDINIDTVLGLEVDLEKHIFNKLKIVGIFSTGSTEEDFEIYEKKHLFEFKDSFVGFDNLLFISPNYDYFNYVNLDRNYLLYNIDTINKDYILCGEIKNDNDIIINIERFDSIIYGTLSNFKLSEKEKEAFPNCETFYDIYRLPDTKKIEYEVFFNDFYLPEYSNEYSFEENFNDKLCYYIFLNCYDRLMSLKPKYEVGEKEYNVVGITNVKTKYEIGLYWNYLLVSKDEFDKYYNTDIRYSAIVYLGDNSKIIKGKMEGTQYFGAFLEYWPIRSEFLDFDDLAKRISNPSNIYKMILILALLLALNIFLYVNLSYKKSKNDIKLLIENKESITKISLMKTCIFFVCFVPFFIPIVPILLLFNEIINPIICNKRNQLNGYNSRIVFRLFDFNYMTIIWCIIALLIILILFFINSYYKIWRIKKYD